MPYAISSIDGKTFHIRYVHPRSDTALLYTKIWNET